MDPALFSSVSSATEVDPAAQMVIISADSIGAPVSQNDGSSSAAAAKDLGTISLTEVRPPSPVPPAVQEDSDRHLFHHEVDDHQPSLVKMEPMSPPQQTEAEQEEQFQSAQQEQSVR